MFFAFISFDVKLIKGYRLNLLKSIERVNRYAPINRLHTRVKQFFYRLTMPQHFEGRSPLQGVGYERRRHATRPNCVAAGVPAEEHWTSVLARRVFSNSTTVRVLDYQVSYKYQRWYFV